MLVLLACIVSRLSATPTIPLHLSSTRHITTSLSFPFIPTPNIFSLLLHTSVPDTYLILCNNPAAEHHRCFSPGAPSFCLSSDPCTAAGRFHCASVTADLHRATPHAFSFFLDDTLVSGLAVEMEIPGASHDSVPIKGIVSFDNGNFRLPDETTGIFGIAAASSSCRDETFFARLLDKSGSIEITIPTANQDGAIVWDTSPVSTEWVSKVQGSTDAALISSTVTELKMCGANFLDGISGYYKVSVDSGRRCLGLPGVVFDRFLRWRRVPGRPLTVATVSTSIAEGSSHSQPEHKETPNQIVTPIDLTEGNGESDISLVFGKTIDKELARVLVTSDVCVEKNPQVPLPYWGQMGKDPIFLGRDVLLGGIEKVRVDVRGGEYGRVQVFPRDAADSLEEGRECAAIPVCIGDQKYFQAANLCENPKCSNFFFAMLDEEKKVCVYESWVKPLFIAVVLGLALVQIFGARLGRLAVEKAGERAR